MSTASRITTGHTFRNWGRGLTCKPKRYCQPESEQEMAEIVKQARAEGSTVRVVGAGHSWSPLVVTDGTLVNLDRMDQLVKVDPERMQVTVGAGIRLKALCEILSHHGLALENIGSVDQQSLAGATATGTHGTGIRIGNLSTGIVGMNLVTGTGEILSLSEDKNPELLTAARVSLGALGIVTQITLQCVRAYNLRLDADLRPFDQVLAQLDQLNAENERVRLYWFSGTDVFYVMRFNPTDEPLTARNPVAAWLNDVFLRQGFMWAMLRAGHTLPPVVEPLNRFQTSIGLRAERTIRRSDHALTVPMPPVHQEMEYAIPVERTAEALRLTRALIREKGYRASFPVEVRFVASDCNMLSPAYGRDVCYLGAYTFGNFTRSYFDGFEPEMKRLGGRPHWGKYHTLTATEGRELYPCYDRFNQIRKELDPSGVFANDYIRKLFNPATEKGNASI